MAAGLALIFAGYGAILVGKSLPRPALEVWEERQRELAELRQDVLACGAAAVIAERVKATLAT